jgi:Flp pilus assembly protein TadG
MQASLLHESVRCLTVRDSSCGSSSSSHRRGAALVLVALLMLVLIGFLGLSLDVAHVRTSAQELQAAADAAALAAVQLVSADDPSMSWPKTRNEAIAVAGKNLVAGAPLVLDANWGNWEQGDIVIGSWDRLEQVFVPSSVDAHVTPVHDAVLVRARRTAHSSSGSLELYFGRIFGVHSSEVSRTAIAQWAGDPGPGVLLLHPTKVSALDIRARALLAVPHDGVQVNSSSDQALRVSGASGVPRLEARGISVHGGALVPDGTCYPLPKEGADVVSDPLAGLPYPDKTSMPNRGRIQKAGNYQPGWYPAGLDFDSGVAQLAPGIYVFGAPGIQLHGTALLQGERVMLFVDMGGRLTLSGTGPGIDLTAPPGETYEGVAIFQHRGNSATSIVGPDALVNVGGTVYLAGARLEMDGVSDRTIGRIVAESLVLKGSSTYTVTGIGHPPPGVRSCFLVK